MMLRRLISAILAAAVCFAGAAGCSKAKDSGYAKPGEAGTPELDEMVKLLKSGDEKGKRLACVGLARLGPGAQSAIPELEKVRNATKSDDLKKLVGETIEKIQAAK